MKDEMTFVGHMLAAAREILEFNKGGKEALYNSELIKKATIRDFTIIGEAVTRISNELQLKHPEVEWRSVKAFRNRLIHDYFDIDYDNVWYIIENKLPILIEQLAKIIKEAK